MRARLEVSVIIANHNYGRFLGLCIDSVLAQTYSPIEIIVVDDGSTDDSRDVLAGYTGRVKALFQENQGQGAALNTGVAAASGDLIALLDADDGWRPEKVVRVVEALESEPRAEWLRHKLEMVDETLVSSGRVAPSFRGSRLVPPDPALFLEGVVTAGTTLVLRRGLSDRIFPLAIPSDLDLHADDAVLLGAIFAEGAWGYSLDETLGFYRRHLGERWGIADLPGLLERDIRLRESLARHFGWPVAPTSTFKHRAVVGALEGAHWWDERRLGNFLGGLRAAAALRTRPALLARQSAALLLAFAAPRLWVRRLAHTQAFAEPEG
jgi:glycosyltransferase involved in cell wall biosynthesis